MRNSLYITNEQFEEIKNSPFFFLRLKEDISYDDRGNAHDNSRWETIGLQSGFNVSANSFGNSNIPYCLCFIDQSEPAYDQKNQLIPGIVKLSFHSASANDSKDCKIVLEDLFNRSGKGTDKYLLVGITWFLDKLGVNERILSVAINSFDDRVRPTLMKLLSAVCRCLSYNNQVKVKSLFNSFGYQYEIYMPNVIVEAFKCCQTHKNGNDLNLFQLVDEIIGKDEIHGVSTERIAQSNPFFCLLRWLNTEAPLGNYSILTKVFPMVSESIRFEIVKRYFHDIRLGHTILDLTLLNHFRDSPYDEFIRLRYSTETPTEPVVLTVPLLCDSLLTIYNSNGQSFQSYDGVLDFAISHCDIAHPAIDFQLERFIPVCSGGAVYNPRFKGFIDYQTVWKLNETKITDAALLSFIKSILDRTGRRQTYPVCQFGNGAMLSDREFAKCSSAFKVKGSEKKYSCKSITYEDKWLIQGDYATVLNSFLVEELPTDEKDKTFPIEINMISTSKLHSYIHTLPAKFGLIGDDEFLVHSYREKSFDILLVEQFSDLLRMRILPQKEALIGQKFDVFGYWKGLQQNLEQTNRYNANSREQAKKVYFQMESQEVWRRTVESLKEELRIPDFNGLYFELPFNRQILNKIIGKYYFLQSFRRNDRAENREFLRLNTRNGRFKPFCAPKLSEIKNPAIGLPYFWCRGQECFHNSLENQTLSEMSDWHSYSIYHLIEIIGYPKLHRTEAGHEPDEVVRNFIAVTNKALQMFKRIRCRCCGHLMFSNGSSGYNRFNHYSCINPNCQARGNDVYLSYCFKCKKGLIDSRDTKKCPNGWYICPTCLACCDDSQYERQAQRYILSGRPVPDRISRMLGHGHNDKEVYFCPSCGSAIQTITDEHGETFKGCPSCRKKVAFGNEDLMF